MELADGEKLGDFLPVKDETDKITYEWHKLTCRGDVPKPRQSFVCHRINSTQLLICGGCDTELDFADAFILDLTTRIWKRLPGLIMETVLVGSASVILHQEKKFFSEYILLFGGWNGDKYIKSTYLFDIKAQSIKKMPESANSPPSRKDHTLTFSPENEKVYLFGGWNPDEWNYTDNQFNELWSLSSSWQWTKEETFGIPPSSRRGHSAVYSAIPVPNLIIYGGVYGYSKFLNDIHIFEIQKKKWTQINPPNCSPEFLAWHSAIIFENNMMIIGGMRGQDEYSQDIFLFNLATYSWTSFYLKLEIPRCSHATMVISESLLILGGVSSDPDNKGCQKCCDFESIQVLEPKTKTLSDFLVQISSKSKTKDRVLVENLMNRFLLMEGLSDSRPSDETKLNSEFYLSKIELMFQTPSYAPVIPSDSEKLDEMHKSKLNISKFNPLSFLQNYGKI